MQFYDAIVTNEGVRMLTAASFSNKLTFTRLLFCADNVTLGVTTQSLEHSWGNGHIDNYATAADGSFVIYGSASNAQDYGMAYGFAVYGYLNSEGEENEHIVFVANADGVPTYVNSQSGAATRFQFAIRAKISLSDQVIRIDPNYNGLVSNIAFQDLLERTVTTHSATDNRVGDDQTVMGHKEFTDGIGVWGDANGWGLEIDNASSNGDDVVRMRTTNGRYYANSIEFKHREEEEDYIYNTMYVNSNITPMAGAIDLTLGSQSRTWGIAYIRNISATLLVASSQIQTPKIEVSNYIRTPTAEVTDTLSFYSTRLENDNIRLVWYDQDTALKFQQGAVRANVEFDVPVKFNDEVQFTTINSMTLTRLTATGASIGALNTSSISANEADVTQLSVGSVISSALKTASFKLNGELSASNYPIQQNNLPIPIGAIRIVAVSGLQDGQELPAGSSLYGLTLTEKCLYTDRYTAQVKVANASVQRETSGGNYITLFAIKYDSNSDTGPAPVTLVMKVRDDMP